MYNTSLYYHDRYLYKTYGFVADLTMSKFENAINVLLNWTWEEYSNRPMNMAFHDLTDSTSNLNPLVYKLLGLGTKFIIQRHLPSMIDLDSGIERFKRDVKIKFEMAYEMEDDEFIPQLYIRSPYQPNVDHKLLNSMLNNFESQLTTAYETKLNSTFIRGNLTSQQEDLLKYLQTHKEFIVLDCDKNLGPAVIERSKYIKRILHEHLRSENYVLLTHVRAKTNMNRFRSLCRSAINSHDESLSKGERKFFRHIHSLDFESFRIPQFYGLPKVHKGITPYVKFRPVVSQCGSYSAYLSTWLDYKLQPFTKYVKSYVKDSFDVIDKIKQCNRFPPNARLFTSDATSMYTNIHPNEGCQAVVRFLRRYAPKDFPIDLITTILQAVMTYNVFKFGSSWWRQCHGTAMGTPCACIYAIIFFAYYEQTEILPNDKFGSNILFYVRQIDDILAVWVDNTDSSSQFDTFKQRLNQVSNLTWNTENLSTSVNFLDLTLTIDNGMISTKTFQKAMNLFLYIPRHSMHPKGLSEGMIYGLLYTFNRQNTKEEDFIEASMNLFKRLVRRGYDVDKLESTFKAVGQRLESPPNSSILRPCRKEERVFFHLTYHNHGLSRRDIRTIYDNTCDRRDAHSLRSLQTRIKQFTICFHRDKNIKDILIPSTLYENEGEDVLTINNSLDT